MAVGDSGTLLTSHNGRDWSARDTGTERNLRGVTWNGSQFICVGQAGTMLASADGTNWRQVRLPVDHDLRGVAAGGGRWIVVGSKGNQGRAVRSEDGVAWEAAGVPATGQLNGVIWDGTRFVGFGIAGGVLTSEDGDAWERVESANKDAFLAAAAGPGGIYLAGSGALALLPTGSGSLRPTAEKLPHSAALAACPEGILAVGDGPGAVHLGTDGTGWTSAPCSLVTRTAAVCWGDGRFVAVGERGRIACSESGIDWDCGVAFRVCGFGPVSASGNAVVAVGNGAVVRSEDLQSWRQHSVPLEPLLHQLRGLLDGPPLPRGGNARGIDRQ